MNLLSKILEISGKRLSNLSYIISNPEYMKVRGTDACPDIYKLLNKEWFPKELIKSVFDVGANEGQFIRTIIALLPKAMIYGFEANPYIASGMLEKKFISNNVEIINIACGKEEGTIPMNISRFSPSSSLLKISKEHIDEFPGTDTKEVINVKMERLDTIISKLKGKKEEPYLLKMDVQGFEMEVLMGSTGILDKTLVVLCEVNIAPLYDNQCEFSSVLMFMEQHNFDLVDMGEPFRSKSDQSILYVDLAFMKRSQ